MIGPRLRRRLLARLIRSAAARHDPALGDQCDSGAGWTDTYPDHQDDPDSDPEPEDESEFTPRRVSVGARVVQTDGGLVAVLAVTGYPAAVYPGWLLPLLNHPGRLDVSVHIDPVPPMTAADLLKKRLGRMTAGQRHDAEHGRVADPNLAAAADDADELALRIARAQTRMYRVGLYLAVYAADPDTLADEVEALRRLAASLMLDVRPASYRQLDGWNACLPIGVNRLGVHRVMDTDPIAASFPFGSDELAGADPVSEAAPDGVFYGFALDSNGLIFHDEFAAENYNTVILGPSGAGKSYLNKATLLRSLHRKVHGHDVHAIIVDPEDEYTPLTLAVGGVVVRMGAPGVRINPFDLPIYHRADGGRHAHTDAARHRSLFLHTFISVLMNVELDPGVRAVLDEAITTTYTRAGIHADDPATWNRPAPILADLAAALTDHPDPAGPTLAAQLRPHTHGAWSGLFNGPTTTPAASSRLMSFSLRELPDELRAVGTLVVLDHIWRHMADPTQRRPRIMVIDEAWLLMSQPIAAAYVRRMVKSDRKWWGAVRFVTQDVIDALSSELGLAVINNAATTILMRQEPQTIDDIARLYGLTAGEQAFLLRAGKGEALLITSTRRIAARVVASPVEDELITTDPAQLAALVVDHDTDSYIELPGHTPQPPPPHNHSNHLDDESGDDTDRRPDSGRGHGRLS